MSSESVNYQSVLTPGHVSASYGQAASAHNKSLSIHRWSNWIAGFSGEFAHNAITQNLPFPQKNSLVMDPFAGVGTTLVEANRLGMNSVGFELNPFASLVCKVKLNSKSVSLDEFIESIEDYEVFIENAGRRSTSIDDDGSHNAAAEPRSLPPPGFKSRIPFFSPAVERKVLFTIDYLSELTPPISELFKVALSSVIVEFSNYSYEPSLGSRPAAGKKLIVDAEVGKVLAARLRQMTDDIAEFQLEAASRRNSPLWQVHETSFFDSEGLIEPGSVDLVVTSPPYMNNYHYVRNSRPQLFWAGLVSSSEDLKRLENNNFGKYWQTVRASAPIPLKPKLPGLADQIAEIREANGSRGAYGGNGWANYIATYMNDLDRFCELLGKFLRLGGTAIVVLGNSIVQGKEVKVDQYLCDLAALRGLTVLGVTRLRDRVGSSIVNSGSRLRAKSKAQLYDAAVTLRRLD